MFKKLVKVITKPAKAWRFFRFGLYHIFRKKRGILFFIGMEPGGVFNLMYRGYKKCYGFEANPERFKKLEKKYKKYSNINLYNVAVAQYDGEITFNISSNNNGASSSIGNFDENWQKKFQGEKIEMIKAITVPCINLNNFCEKNNIDSIDDYVSDIQGMDLEVLKTIRPMIERKMIKNITCEVTKNEKGNIYSDLPDNSEEGFNKLLEENYKLIAKGSGILKKNTFDKIPKNKWEFDCAWALKD